MFLSSEKGKRILVFAGPNGSGKSTVTKKFAIVGTYVNADDIKRQLNCTDLEAAQAAENIREQLLANGMPFTFETVLSTSRNIELLVRAKKMGYKITALYVLTCSSDINVDRVKYRAQHGGHDVPVEKIKERYIRSLQNLPALIKIADRIIIVDNSDRPQMIYTADSTIGVQTIKESSHWSAQEINLLISGQLCK